MSRVSLLENRWTMTGRLDVRFRKPVLLHHHVRAVGTKMRERGSYVQAMGRVELPDGEVAAEAEGTFVYLEDKSLAEMSADYPLLAKTWTK